MGNKFNGLEIIDRFLNLGERVLEEEITILAPYLRDKVLKAISTGDHKNGKKEDQGGAVRKSKHK